MVKAEGPCLGNFPRWHFDATIGMCREFTYSGCEGNKNRFVDRESCERLCNQTRPYLVPSVDVNIIPTQPDYSHRGNEINIVSTYEEVSVFYPCVSFIIYLRLI